MAGRGSPRSVQSPGRCEATVPYAWAMTRIIPDDAAHNGAQ